MTSLIQHFENPPLMAFDQTEIQGITNTQLDFESNQYGTCQVLETCGACWRYGYKGNPTASEV